MSENRIKSLRELFKLSQAQLAEKAGVTDKAVSTWENGTRQPDSSTLKLLREAFGGLSTDYLMGEEPQTEGDKATEAKFAQVATMAKANDKCKALIERCIKFCESKGGTADWGILPFVDKNGEIVYQAFNDDGTPDYQYLVDMGRDDEIAILCPEQAKLWDVIYLDSPFLVETSLKRLLAEQKPKREYLSAVSLARYDSESAYTQEINAGLGKLVIDQSNYWPILKLLIENGAYFKKPIQWNADGSIAAYGPDEERTALAYNCAKSFSK